MVPWRRARAKISFRSSAGRRRRGEVVALRRDLLRLVRSSDFVSSGSVEADVHLIRAIGLVRDHCLVV